MSIPVPHQPPSQRSQLRLFIARLRGAWPGLRGPSSVGLTCGFIALLWTITLPNQYRSESRILPADQRASGGFAATAATLGVSVPGQESPDAGLVDILNSRSLREALLQTRFSFRVRTWYFGGYEQREQSLYEYLKVKNIDRAVGALKKRLFVVRDIKTKLITITVDTESPELSQKIAMRAVGLLDEFVVTKAQTRGGAKAAFSAKRLAEARLEMVGAEAAFQWFLESNRNFLVSADPAVRMRGLRLDNELKLRTQVVTTLAIAHEQALLEEKNDMPILNILDSGNLPYEKQGPPRVLIIFVCVLLGFTGFWLFENWAWFNERFLVQNRNSANPADRDSIEVKP